MTKLLGVEFAPLNIPLERRLQTFAVFQWTLSFLFLGFGCLFFSIYLVLCTRYFYVPLVYLLWYVIDKDKPSRGGRTVSWVRGWTIWKWFRDYFPVRLIKTAELDPKNNYIIGFHPHGVMSAGAFCNFATDANSFKDVYPGIRPVLLVLKGQFQFPFYREYLMTTGACDCSKESIEWLLTREGRGNAVFLVVGGAAEALEAHPGTFRLNLSRRKGFIRLALQHGAHLVPVYSFGENDVFEQIDNPQGSFLRSIQTRMMRFMGFSLPLIRGRGVFNYTFGIMPFRRPIDTVVGAPIEIPQLDQPTKDDVDKWHHVYVDALTRLFEEHKRNNGVSKDQHLEII